MQFNPRTLTPGDFHPGDCFHVIFIVLPLSELRGSLGSFLLLTDVIEGMRVSLLRSLVFSTGTCSGDFHPALVIEGKTFFIWNLPNMKTVSSPNKTHMSQEWVDRRASSQLH